MTKHVYVPPQEVRCDVLFEVLTLSAASRFFLVADEVHFTIGNKPIALDDMLELLDHMADMSPEERALLEWHEEVWVLSQAARGEKGEVRLHIGVLDLVQRISSPLPVARRRL